MSSSHITFSTDLSFGTAPLAMGETDSALHRTGFFGKKNQLTKEKKTMLNEKHNVWLWADTIMFWTFSQKTNPAC